MDQVWTLRCPLVNCTTFECLCLILTLFNRTENVIQIQNWKSLFVFGYLFMIGCFKSSNHSSSNAVIITREDWYRATSRPSRLRSNIPDILNYWYSLWRKVSLFSYWVSVLFHTSYKQHVLTRIATNDNHQPWREDKQGWELQISTTFYPLMELKQYSIPYIRQSEKFKWIRRNQSNILRQEQQRMVFVHYKKKGSSLSEWENMNRHILAKSTPLFKNALLFSFFVLSNT